MQLDPGAPGPPRPKPIHDPPSSPHSTSSAPSASLTWLTLLLAVVVCILLRGPTTATAQLRPLEPFDWMISDRPATLLASAGGAVLFEQRASLAGTQGRLAELGAFHLAFHTGRVVLEAGGTAYRLLDEVSRFSPPAGEAEARPLGRRSDSGDYRIVTSVFLSSPERPAAALLRFGTRLPTTDNRVGLERDMTDFFALLAGRYDRGRLRTTTEVGLGIQGTRDPDFEQSDVLLYSLTLGLVHGRVQPALLLLGQADGLNGWTIRGNEDLAELRLRVRAGGDRAWLQLEGIRGLTPFSPGSGITASFGLLH